MLRTVEHITTAESWGTYCLTGYTFTGGQGKITIIVWAKTEETSPKIGEAGRCSGWSNGTRWFVKYLQFYSFCGLLINLCIFWPLGKKTCQVLLLGFFCCFLFSFDKQSVRKPCWVSDKVMHETGFFFSFLELNYIAEANGQLVLKYKLILFLGFRHIYLIIQLLKIKPLNISQSIGFQVPSCSKKHHPSPPWEITKAFEIMKDCWHSWKREKNIPRSPAWPPNVSEQKEKIFMYNEGYKKIKKINNKQH